MTWIAAICTVVIVVYMLSCMFHKEPKRTMSPYTLEKLRRDSDPGAVCWRGKA